MYKSPLYFDNGFLCDPHVLWTIKFTPYGTTKIIHYRQVSLNRSNPIVFLPIVVDTSGHIYEDFSRRLVSILTRSP
jgi:hypothetical protein